MQDDERAAARLVLDRICFDGRCVKHERLRLVIAELLLGRLDEERLREQRMPRAVGDDAKRESVRGIGPGKGVHDVEVASFEKRDHLVAEGLELLLPELLIDIAPRNPVLAAGLANDVLVVRRPAGMRSGVDDERSALGQLPVAAPQRVHVEERGGRIGEDATPRLEAVLAQIDRSAYVLDDCHPHSFGSTREFPAGPICPKRLHIVWQWRFDRPIRP